MQLNSSTNATITFRAGNSVSYEYYFVDHDAIAINSNGPASISNIQAFLGSTNISGDYSVGGSDNVSTFGTFNQTLYAKNAYPDRAKR